MNGRLIWPSRTSWERSPLAVGKVGLPALSPDKWEDSAVVTQGTVRYLGREVMAARLDALCQRGLFKDQGESTGGTFQEDIAKLAAEVKRETLGMSVIVTMVCFNEKVGKITSKLFCLHLPPRGELDLAAGVIQKGFRRLWPVVGHLGNAPPSWALYWPIGQFSCSLPSIAKLIISAHVRAAGKVLNLLRDSRREATN